MAEGDRIYITRKKAILNREQKTGLGMVVSFGSLALVFGVFFLWKHIASPFVISYVGPKFLTGDEKAQQQMEALKKQDTDTDMLNDYLELYVYKTSPYLKDTDSDGTEDGVEIAQQQDPNCAANQPCATAAAETVSASTLKGTFAEEIAAEVGAIPEPGAIPEKIDLAGTLNQMTIDEVRSLLIQSGGDAATINALTDDQLRAALSQALSQLEGTGVIAESTTTTATEAESASDTPAENPTE